uniref:Leucine-rich repeat protein n=1 Tax=Bodo saltans TaxID=75058 RepID=B6DTA6_BODSA|nr:hypothetical protein [Bodo saltans]
MHTRSSSSIAQTYEALCKRHNAHCNSQLKKTLVGSGSTPTSSTTLREGELQLSSSSTSSSLANVKHLDFSNNMFGRNGILPVLETILPFCPNLESLNLSKNYLSNESIVFLYTLLQPGERAPPNEPNDDDDTNGGSTSPPLLLCPRLQYLDLSHNPISSQAGKLLSRLVDNLPHLRNVQLDGTLMNKGLQSVVLTKCAKKSPRFDGLRALSMVVSEGRPTSIATSTTPPPIVPTDTTLQPSSSTVSADTKHGSGPRRSSSPTTIIGLKRPGMVPPSLITLDAAALSIHHAHHPHEDVNSAVNEHAAAAEWTAMETIWNLATVAAPPRDGWTGLAAVMALVRQDATIASMY